MDEETGRQTIKHIGKCNTLGRGSCEHVNNSE